MVYHGIHVAAHNQETQPRLSQNVDGLGIFPVGLGKNADLITGGLQHPADDGVAEGGVVHIGVADDIDKVALLPAPGLHIPPGDGQKISHSLDLLTLVCALVPHVGRDDPGAPLQPGFVKSPL